MRSFYTRYLVAPTLLLLVAAFAFGHWNNARVAGPATRAVLNAAQAHCPSVTSNAAGALMVGAGARAIDRAAWRLVADALLGGVRCQHRAARRPTAESVPYRGSHRHGRSRPHRHGGKTAARGAGR